MRLLRWLFTWLGWHFRWQNLNDLPGGGKGRLLKQGRCWLNNEQEYEDKDGKYHYRKLTWEIQVEWFLGGCRCALELALGEGDINEDFHFTLGIPLLGSIYINVQARWISWLCLRLLPTREHKDGKRLVQEERYLSLRVFDGGLWWIFWLSEDVWRSSDPWYRRGVFRPVDFLLGKRRYTSTEAESGSALIPMPEGCYNATYRITYDQWTRPRWPWRPFSTSRYRCHVDVPGGIPVPGKGENSWDCDDDAVGSLTAVGRNKWEAIGQMVESAMRDRIRYGGSERMSGLGGGFGEYMVSLNEEK